MSKERNVVKENAILTGIIAAPLAALVGGPAAAALSVGAGILVGNKKTRDYYEKQARIDREIAERSAQIYAEQEAERERRRIEETEEYAIGGAVDRQGGRYIFSDEAKINKSLEEYFKDKADIVDDDVNIYFTLYRPKLRSNSLKCQIGDFECIHYRKEGKTTTIESDTINLRSIAFKEVYDEFASKGEDIELHYYLATSSVSQTLFMKVNLKSGETKKFCCTPNCHIWG